MNRNVLKIIAVITMIIDHIGLFLLNNNFVCRCIGRLAFPLFAFFIAEGMKYTRSRKKYAFNLFIFAFITQIPYGLLQGWQYLNVLFTFLISIALIVLIELYKKETSMAPILKNIFITFVLFFILLVLLIGEIVNLFDYGLIGVLLVLCFYFIKSKLRLVIGALIILLQVIKSLIFSGVDIFLICRLFALLSIILLLFYNNNKGRFNLKYLFYIAYPANFFIFYLISLF